MKWNIKVFKGVVLLLSLLMSLVVYYFYGSWQGVFVWENNQHSTVYYSPLLEQVNIGTLSLNDLKKLIKKRVLLHPKEAQGWYLMSKLALRENHLQAAYRAASRAYQILPNDINVCSHYLKVTFLSEQDKELLNTKKILNNLKLLAPNNVLVQDFSALFSYQEHHYQEAIVLWKSILKEQKLTKVKQHLYVDLIKKAQKKWVQKNPLQLIIDYQVTPKMQRKVGEKSYVYITIRRANELTPKWFYQVKASKLLNNKIILTSKEALFKPRMLPLNKALALEVRFSTHKSVFNKEGDLYGRKKLFLTYINHNKLYSSLVINHQFV